MTVIRADEGRKGMTPAQFSTHSVQAQKKSPIVLEKIHPRSLNEANIRFVSGMNARPGMSAATHHAIISFPIIQMIAHPNGLCNETVDPNSCFPPVIVLKNRGIAISSLL